MTEKFKKELTSLLNRYGYDTVCEAPDYILADYIGKCLENYCATTQLNIAWHDLRKDPEDLPREGVELLVSVDGYTRTAMYSKETNSFTCQEGVIAWMYEPKFNG